MVLNKKYIFKRKNKNSNKINKIKILIKKYLKRFYNIIL